MPRPPQPTPLRRILEQTIMWIVLAGTVGTAALVDRGLNQLGGPESIDGITLRPPRNWRATDNDGEGRLERRERGDELFVRTLTVRPLAPALSLESLVRGTPRLHGSEQLNLRDGGVAKITVLSRPRPDPFGRNAFRELEIIALVTPPQGRVVMIAIRQYTFTENLESNIDLNTRLMKRILETVRFGGPG